MLIRKISMPHSIDMPNRRTVLLIALWAIALVAVVRGAAARHSYTIDASRSRATIEVGKAGLLGFAAGHTHEVVASGITGSVSLDSVDLARSSAHVTIDASTLQVTGKGEPADDVPKVQATMVSAQVLDVRRYPEITFVATDMTIRSNQGGAVEALVTGRLTLHGVTRSIAVPVAARVEGRMVTATGRFAIKQTDYGIQPVSVGGVVSVKDSVNVSFTIVAAED
jgi:polyisoprenoid-binding protein YceI